MSTNDEDDREVTKRLSAPYLSNVSLRLFTPLVERFSFISSLLFWNSGVGNLRNRTFEDDVTMIPLPLPKELFEIEEEKNVVGLEIFRQGKEKNHSFSEHSSYFSALDFHEAYLSKKLTPLKVCESLILKIQESHSGNSSLDCICMYNQDDIIAQATASTARYEQNLAWGPLDGVPIAVKDEVDVKGYETRAGTKYINLNNPAQKDSFAVKKLKDKGAIIIGKTSMHEIGLDITGNNPNFLTPRNPYNVEHYSGGSSGGSGCVVAAGLCPIAIGCDGGGSIRVPSAFCGIYGLKTTCGRVSATGKCVGGPMASSAEDLAMSYYVMAGKDPEDPKTFHQPSPTLHGLYSTDDLSDLKIGVFSAWNKQVTNPAISEAVKTFTEAFKLRGAEIVEIEIPELEEARLAHVISIGAEHNAAISKYNGNHLLTHPNRILLSVTSNITVSDYMQAQQVRNRAMRNLSKVFSQVNLILTPTTAITAPKIRPSALKYGEVDSLTTSDGMRFMQLSNFTGIPAVSVPAGYDDNQLPIGLHFMAKWYDEATLLRMAKASEEILGSKRKRPDKFWFGNWL
ncbi:17271_t:CDS:10 [Acaulospora morrowiae]|uniref:17271_t:CDS:1 n=1 Tax=Acaulospora morrowiae TaxID=94023 RepID=A0A9N9FGN5_9GLOM|nr:17271_t:CDS:10 [Acaulospora morrowiae]